MNTAPAPVPLDPTLVALVRDRFRHPSFLPFRSHIDEICDLLAAYPAHEWDEAITRLYVDGDQQVRTHFRMLRIA